MKIHVSWEDIKKGQPNSLTACPVALALRRKLKNDNVWVNYNHINVMRRSYDTYTIDSFGRAFIKAFDRLENVFPMTITLKKKGH